jgi:retinol dehydrogenase 12
VTEASKPAAIVDEPIMAGRVCVLTGASSGIGKAACVALARLGATVVLVARDRGRGAAAMSEVGAVATGDEPSLEIADLSSQEEVRDLARRLGQLPRIDVLINNAGLVAGRREFTVDEIEYTFAVNHLAPFLLTNLLAGKLATDPPARIVTVASLAHRAARLNPEQAAKPALYLPMLAYANSKLANILFTRELARRLDRTSSRSLLDGTSVTANCLHPGTVSTHFGQSGPLWLRGGMKIIGPVIRSPQSGARTLVYLASSPDLAARTGGYYVNCRRHQPSRVARDDDLAHRLWDVSAELTGLPASALLMRG